jgi:chemotaxis response regulator CheB
VRIGIVNDVMLALEAVRRVIADGSGHKVAWVAMDGEEAVARCAADTPDLVLMDLVMPRVDGVEATRRIMASNPCPVVVVTASVNDNSSRVFEAMGAGALDAVNTPVYDERGSAEGGRDLIQKIETIRRLIGAPAEPPGTAGTHRSSYPRNTCFEPLVVIGASAGGPSALARVLAYLPLDFPPLVVVQHVGAQFAKGLVSWLGNQTRLRIRLAQEGEQPLPGTVLLAGADQHLVLTRGERLSYEADPVACSYRPSIDVLFRSVEQNWDGDVIGVLLTGMGRDGAEGLRVLREAGHHTIAQDRQSSAVYGMPKAAIELQAAAEILALERIGPRLVELISVKARVRDD